MALLWPAAAALLPGLWSYGSKKRMIWTGLALLLLPVLVIILGVLILGAFLMTWRSVVWQACGLCFVTGCAMLLVWAGAWLWREVAAGRWHPVAVWLCRIVGIAGIGFACVVSTMFASFLALLLADFDHTEERDGQKVVTQYEWDNYNYYAYYGPLIRGTELLAGSWDLHVREVEEQEALVRARLARELGLKTTSSFVVYANEDTHGGFHNDGETYIQLWFTLNISPLIEDDPAWSPLPLPEELAALARLCHDENGGSRIPVPENGYYWFQDRQAEDIRDYSGTMSRYSYNFALAVYDTDTGRLYFWKLDT